MDWFQQVTRLVPQEKGWQWVTCCKLASSVARHNLPTSVTAVPVIKRLYVFLDVRSIGISIGTVMTSPAAAMVPATLSVKLKKNGSIFELQVHLQR